MMQTMNRYTATTTAKTAEIMARYRPIAPKPQLPPETTTGTGGGGGEADQNIQNPSSMSPNIRHSPYLRNVWPHLQARPTRTRKRGRTSLAPPPPSLKRPRTPFQVTTTNSPAKNLSLQGFGFFHSPSPNGGLSPPQVCPLPSLATLSASSSGLESPTLVTLPLLPRLSSTLPRDKHHSTNLVDLNRVAQIPEEKDFLTQLQGPTVISPQPIRLIGSSISIWSIKYDERSTHGRKLIQQKAEEVEKELESEALPAVVSDSNNKVRLVNSAYKEMVGQPECPWLDSMVTGGDSGGTACKRICGEVTLHFHPQPNVVDDVLASSDRFSCMVSIEWGSNGKKAAVNAFCQVTRLFCESRDYLFAWKLHTRGEQASSDAASTV